MNNYGTRQLETKRLVLRKFSMEDVTDVYENWGSDENVARWFAFNAQNNMEETKAIVLQWLEAYKNNHTYIWAVEEKENNKVIGTINADMAYEVLETCELAYSLGSKWWGKGYMTEAVREVLRYLLFEEEVYLIEAKHNSDNIGSGKVLSKAGMKKEAVLRDRRIDKLTGKRSDLIIYSIKRTELDNE